MTFSHTYIHNLIAVVIPMADMQIKAHLTYSEEKILNCMSTSGCLPCIFF